MVTPAGKWIVRHGDTYAGPLDSEEECHKLAAWLSWSPSKWAAVELNSVEDIVRWSTTAPYPVEVKA
jgi:hypothetical protein